MFTFGWKNKGMIYLLFSDRKWITEGVYNPGNELELLLPSTSRLYISARAQIISWDAVILRLFWVYYTNPVRMEKIQNQLVRRQVNGIKNE